MNSYWEWRPGGLPSEGVVTCCGAVAQWLEQGTHNPWVVGSIPTGPTESAVRQHRVSVESVPASGSHERVPAPTAAATSCGSAPTRVWLMKVTLVTATLDLVASLLFVALGLHAHHHGIGDVLAVWGPFAVGVVIGSLVLWRLAWPPLSSRSALVLTVVAVTCAMLLRLLFAQGVVAVFVVVATVFLGLFVSLWRLIARRWWRDATPTSH